jgi:hypothetical protein
VPGPSPFWSQVIDDWHHLLCVCHLKAICFQVFYDNLYISEADPAYGGPGFFLDKKYHTTARGNITHFRVWVIVIIEDPNCDWNVEHKYKCSSLTFIIVNALWFYCSQNFKLFGQVWFNLVQRFQMKRFKCDLLSMVLGWVPFKIVSDRPAFHSRWLLLLKISSNCPLLLYYKYYKQNRSRLQ